VLRQRAAGTPSSLTAGEELAEGVVPGRRLRGVNVHLTAQKLTAGPEMICRTKTTKALPGSDSDKCFLAGPSHM
jgi:hypothetical protein